MRQPTEVAEAIRLFRQAILGARTPDDLETVGKFLAILEWAQGKDNSFSGLLRDMAEVDRRAAARSKN